MRGHLKNKDGESMHLTVDPDYKLMSRIRVSSDWQQNFPERIYSRHTTTIFHVRGVIINHIDRYEIDIIIIMFVNSL